MWKNTHGITIGSDPEIFGVQSDDRDDLPFAFSPAATAFLHSVPILGGPAKHPIYIDNQDFRVIGDGVAWEINLKRPYYTPKEMWEILQASVDSTQEVLARYNQTVYKKPVARFDFERWWTKEFFDNEFMRWGMVFGCDKDYDAIGGNAGSEIEDASRHPYRYAGGHIHIGHPLVAEHPVEFVWLMAVYVGNWCLANSPFPELEKMRAYHYGKPGRYRTQQYPDGSGGVEYRTPSNSWLSFPYHIFEYIFDLTNIAIGKLKEGMFDLFLEENMPATIEAITAGDSNASMQVLKRIGVC